jgi:hypothetical protein
MKYGNDPSMGHKSSGGSKTPSPSNTGATGSLKKASAGGAPGSVGTMGKVSTKNPFPNGMC